MEALKNFDTALFHLLNGRLTNRVFDAVMPFVTDLDNFIVIIAISVVGLFVFGRGKGRWSVALLVVAVAAGDLTAGLIKDIFARVRPCHDLDGVRLLIGCGGAFSFPSAHATNITAAMGVLSTRYRKLSPAFLFIAVLVSYSRVYVGVHYPLDVAAGFVLGGAIALGIFEADRRLVRYLRERALERTESL